MIATPHSLIKEAEKIVGTPYVLTQIQDTAPYLTDWRRFYTGNALAVICPASPEEIAAIVKLCLAHGISIVPQGGNTGLCGGATPNKSGQQIVLSTRRLNQIRSIDDINNTLVAEAGCTLLQTQEAAQKICRLFPLSLASEGSCTIGGNLSTNAGGIAVLRYGNMRDLTLGLEVVTAQGQLLHDLSGLRKNNTGYDLRNLYIGAEGTLGIITAATLKLFPLPQARATALVAVHSLEQSLQLLNLTQNYAGAALTSFEIISDFCLRIVCKHFQMALPFEKMPPYALLLELSDLQTEQHVHTLLSGLLEQALEHNLAQDAVIANSLEQAKQLWRLRELISEAEALESANIKHDISLPLSQIAAFCAICEKRLFALGIDLQLIIFGHLGDGNLHYNVDILTDNKQIITEEIRNRIHQVVYQTVAEYGGSVSAEHGIGQQKVEMLPHYKDPVALQLMYQIKQALDPTGLMNPGKVLRHIRRT